MGEPAAEYDPRYLAGIMFFNARDFFEAHEVWEDLWGDTGAGGDRKFYQGLIQSAVALFHFGNGNVRGASRLYHSSRDYMAPYGPHHLGLDVKRFWQEMQACFADILGSSTPPAVRVNDELIPTITLDPPPPEWPDPQVYLRDDERIDKSEP